MTEAPKMEKANLRSFYTDLPKESPTKQLLKRLLDGQFIRHSRTKDGQPCFVFTPKGRLAFAIDFIHNRITNIQTLELIFHAPLRI